MAWGYGTAFDTTIRDIAQVGVGGTAIRVRISNRFGNQPLALGAATVGLRQSGATIVPGSLHTLTFSGTPTVTIPVGGHIYSDPVPMAVSPLQTLAVSVYVANTDLMSLHPCCTATTDSYFAANGGGNLTGGLTQAGYTVAAPWDRLVDAIDVLQSTGQGSIVVIGDSITDGYNPNKSPNPNLTVSWINVLQRRIDTLPPSEQRAVVNEAITGNTLTAVPGDKAMVGGGPPGLSRLALDAFSQSGVSEVILFLGTNDLYFGATGAQVIAGLQSAITMVHQAGLRIIGVTLTPREASFEERWSTVQQGYLQQVDNWILTSGAFDAVLNFATTVADVYNGACSPTTMFPPYDSSDHLHPNTAGETAMANSVNTTLLGLPATPTVPPLLAVTPTPGCAGTLGIPAATTSTTSSTSRASATLATKRRAVTG